MDNEEEFLTVAEIAKELKISIASTYRILGRGELPFYSFHGIRRILKSDLYEYLKRNRTAAKEEK